MSAVTYKKICTIKITHDYFSHSINRSISLEPGLVTKELTKLYNIHVNSIQNTFSVYINSNTSTEDFLSYIESVTTNNYFDFNIQVASPDFYGYTDIPMDSNASYLYESNASENRIDTNVVLLSLKENAERLNNTFAKVKIYFQDIIENPSEEHRFLIAFKARAIFWQYYIISNSQINLSNPLIKGNNEVEFHEPKQVTIANGQNAMEFTTKQPLKLSESPKYLFDLYFTISANGQLSEQKSFRLPYPNPINLKTSNENGNQKILSPMYIYV